MHLGAQLRVQSLAPWEHGYNNFIHFHWLGRQAALPSWTPYCVISSSLDENEIPISIGQRSLRSCRKSGHDWSEGIRPANQAEESKVLRRERESLPLSHIIPRQVMLQLFLATGRLHGIPPSYTSRNNADSIIRLGNSSSLPISC